MNRTHRKTLADVFATPTGRTLEWVRIEGLLKAAGCTVVEGSGSRVRFVHDATQRIATFHRPHPQKEAKAYQVEQARDFLADIGVTP